MNACSQCLSNVCTFTDSLSKTKDKLANSQRHTCFVSVSASMGVSVYSCVLLGGGVCDCVCVCVSDVSEHMLHKSS